MRRNQTRYARRGGLQGSGATVKDAKADLESLIDYACIIRSPHIETRYGCVLIIAATASGLESRIIQSDDIAEHGKVWTCSSMHFHGEIADEIKSIRNHVAQLAWRHEADDELHISVSGLDEGGKRELARWIQFQRDYAKHKAAGKTDGESHALACGYSLS